MTDVVHVSPLWFGEGYIGGGERYPLELARAMAEEVPTKLVSFGPRTKRLKLGRLGISILPTRARWKGYDVNPLSELLPLALGRARVVHAHQYESVVTDQCLLWARALGRGRFVTEHGGRGRHFGRRLGLHRLVTQFLPVSSYSVEQYPQLAPRTSVIYGGVDVQRFKPSTEPRENMVLFVGRLIPTKGVEYAISGIDAHTPLHLVGPSYDRPYRAELERLAAGRDVTFHDPPPQDELVKAFQRAKVFVLPSVYESPFLPLQRTEMFPLVLLEAMASGTPVVASAVGGIPELVQDGVNGFLVPPNDADAVGARVGQLLDDPALWARMSKAAVETVRAHYTWPAVARRALEAYAANGEL
jgi:glycosyltransferase involved in cell wall biosynthesis